jgi:hypothetical protein
MMSETEKNLRGLLADFTRATTTDKNNSSAPSDAPKEFVCTACGGRDLHCSHCDGMGIEPRKEVGYRECHCLPSMLCDGNCRPIYESSADYDRRAALATQPPASPAPASAQEGQGLTEKRIGELWIKVMGITHATNRQIAFAREIEREFLSRQPATTMGSVVEGDHPHKARAAAMPIREIIDRLRLDADGGMACDVFMLRRAADLLEEAAVGVVEGKWSGDDSDALIHLDPNFTDTAGLLRPKTGYTPTPKDFAAIDYLCNEWDYAYEPSPMEAAPQPPADSARLGESVGEDEPPLPDEIIFGASRFGTVFKGHTTETLRQYARTYHAHMMRNLGGEAAK